MKYIKGKIFREKYLIENGYIGLENGLIKEIGKGEPPKKSFCEGFILPSFINGHTHLGDYYIDVDPKNYSLAELVGPGGLKENELKNLSFKEKLSGFKEALKEGFNKGVTHFCDFREGGVEGAKTLLRAKNSVASDVLIYGRPTKVNGDEILDLLNYVDGLGISGVNDYSKEQLSVFKDIITRHNVSFGIHAGESLESQRKSIKNFNKTEIERALSLKPNYLVHVTNPLRDDLKLISEEGVPIIICPRSNYKTEVGLPPFEDLMELNNTVGLGTDNAMINSISIIDELRFLYKKYFNDTEKISIEKLKSIFKLATIENGEIFDIDNRIKEETQANLVVFEKKRDPLRSILEGKNKIKATIKGGNIQYV